MKYIIISILLFLTIEASSQVVGGFIAPNNIAVLGYDTNSNLIGKPGRIYVLKPTNVQSPLTLVNDTTIGITGAALTKTDDANVTLTLGGTPTTALLQATSLTLGWTGSLSIARGGTNNGSLSVTNGTVYYGDGSKLLGLAPAADGTVLTLASGIPSWAAAAGGGWGLTGNAGTSAGTNFVGTTDAAELMIKTASIIRASFGARSYIDSMPIWRGAGTTRTTNVAIGDSALFLNTTGTFNTALGNFAMARTLGAGVNNTAVGYQALWKNTTGLNNTAIGSGALPLNTTASNNTVVGAGAMGSNLTGANNTAIGSQALAVNTAASNTATGYTALSVNTSGSSNTASGFQALKNNTVGSFQAAFGANALTTATGGATERNSAFGSGALQGITSGYSNTSIGESALYQATTGNFNTRAGAEYTGVTGITTGRANSLYGANIVAGNVSSTIIISDGDGLQSYYTNSWRKTGIRNQNPTSILQTGYGTKAVFGAPFKIPYFFQATTAATGTGTTSTLTFAAQLVAPFSVGDTIIVAGVTPAGYNGTWRVTGGSTTTVTFLNSTTGAQTVAGTIEAGFMPTTPENGAIGRDSIDIKVQLGTGDNLREYTLAKILKGSATLDFGSTLAGTVTDLTITVTGAADGDVVDVGVPNGSYPATGTFSAWVSAANTVTIRYANNSLTLTQDPASGTFKAKVFKD